MLTCGGQVSHDGAVQELVPSLMEMLDATDSAAEAVGSLIAQTLVGAPEHLAEPLLNQVSQPRNPNSETLSQQSSTMNPKT